MCILLSFKGKKERKCKCKCELLLNLMSLLTTSAFLCPLDSKTPPKGGLLASTSSLTCLFLHLGSLGSCAGPEGPSCKSPAAYIHRALRFSYSTSGLGGPPQGRTSSFLKRWRPRRTAVALGAPLQPGHHARRLSGSAVMCRRTQEPAPCGFLCLLHPSRLHLPISSGLTSYPPTVSSSSARSTRVHRKPSLHTCRAAWTQVSLSLRDPFRGLWALPDFYPRCAHFYPPAWLSHPA